MSISHTLLLNPRNPDQLNTISPGLLDFIKQSEGFSGSAYFDNRQFSVGYGTKATSANESIDEEEATKRLEERLVSDREKIIEFRNANGYDWGPDQINALQSFTYNLGMASLNQVTANGTRTNDQIAEAMLKYVNADGQPLPGLVDRRQREQLAFTNVTQEDGVDPLQERELVAVPSVDDKPNKAGELQEVVVTAKKRDSKAPKEDEFGPVGISQDGLTYMEGPSPYATGEQIGMASTEPMLFPGPRPVDFGSAIEYMRTTGIHKRKFDLNDPLQMMLINSARTHARQRILEGKDLFYKGGDENPDAKLLYLFNALQPEEPPEVDITELNRKAYLERSLRERKKKFVGTLRAIAGGATFEFADELEALFRSEIAGSSTPEGTYSSEYALIKKQQREFESLYPGISTFANFAATIPTAGALWKSAKAIAPNASNAAIAGTEGALYGAGSGDTFSQRIAFSGLGLLGGYSLGKVIDIATKPSSAGGLRTRSNELADDGYLTDEAITTELEQAAFEETLEETLSPAVNVKPLREATTIGEFYDSMVGNMKKFYSDKLRGVADSLAADVSQRFGFLYQRADETALRNINKALTRLGPRLIPVVKTLNQSERAKGALLDYAGGKLLTKKELGDFYFDAAERDARGRFKKRLTPEQRAAKANELRELALSRLEKELRKDLTSDQINVLKNYLSFSFERNKALNKKVFGAEFGDEITYLHTRNNRWRKEIMEAEGLDDKAFELKYGDTAYEGRTRGSYLGTYVDNQDGMFAPVLSEYDNPIITDMQRIFKMEKLAQLQSKFGVDINPVISGKLAARSAAIAAGDKVPTTTALTPSEFMDAFYHTLVRKGLSNDGAQYGVNKIQDHILGTAKSPHPLIQAANSSAYALTLAGPLSAVLNLADIPLLGAKYGGGAVKEGLKAVLPNKFKKVPDVDLERLGLSNQTFGEFVNLINDNLTVQQGWMTRTAELMRKGADYSMKGSGFAALDSVGKQGVLRGVLKSAVDDASVGNLGENWGFYFNKKELELISDQLKKHGTDWRKYDGAGKELIEELMFAGLGQQQLISAAGRPSAWARHPNLRPLWALRGFVLKQQALALREVVGNLKAGRPDKAVKFLGRYAAYGAGGYAIINEGRHAIFGDGNVSAGGLVRGYGDAWASLLTANTLGLNDYQYGKIKEEGIVMTFAKGMMPIALTRPYDIGEKFVGVIDGKRPPQALLREVPLARDILRLGENISDEESFIGRTTFGAFSDQGNNEFFREMLRQRNADTD